MTNKSRKLLLFIIITTVFFSFTEKSRGDLNPTCYRWAPSSLGLAITPDATKAYIPFSLTDSLVVVDLTTLSEIGCVDVSTAGKLLLSTIARCTPDGRYIFIANYGAENVMVLNATTNMIETVLPIKPTWRESIKMNQTGTTVYISTDSLVYAVDTTDLSFEELPYSLKPKMVPSQKNSNLFYFIDDENGQWFFYTYDLPTQTVVKSTPIPVDGPGALLIIDSSESVAYFTHHETINDQGQGTLFAFDLINFQLLSSTVIENGITDFVLNEYNNKIYLIGFWSGGASLGSLNITEWDTTTHTISRLIPLSSTSDLRAIAVDPVNPNYLYVTDGDHNSMSKIDISTGSEVERLYFSQSEFKPRSIILGEDMGYIVGGSSTVLKIDLSTGQLAGNFSLPEGVYGAGYHQGYLYFAPRHGQTIYKVNPSNGAIVQTYDTGIEINTVELTFFNNKMAIIDYYPNGMVGRKLLFLDVETMQVLKSIDLPYEPHSQQVIASPDGSKLYLAHGHSGGPMTVTIMNGSSLETIQTVVIPSQGATCFGGAYFDETNRLLYLLGMESVCVLNMDTNELVDILELYDVSLLLGKPNAHQGTGLCGISVSPEKDKLFIVSGDTASMYTYDLAHSEWLTEILYLNGYFITDVATSPDGRYLYTVNLQSDDMTIVDTTTRQIVDVVTLEPETNANSDDIDGGNGDGGGDSGSNGGSDGGSSGGCFVAIASNALR